jgi:hypothetical protein
VKEEVLVFDPVIEEGSEERVLLIVFDDIQNAAFAVFLNPDDFVKFTGDGNLFIVFVPFDARLVHIKLFGWNFHFLNRGGGLGNEFFPESGLIRFDVGPEERIIEDHHSEDH